MPAKGKSRLTGEQKKAIAAGKAMGKTSRQIADDLGVGKTTVDKQAIKPDHKSYLEAIEQECAEEVIEAYKKAVRGAGNDAVNEKMSPEDRSRARRDVLAIVSVSARLRASQQQAEAEKKGGDSGGGEFFLEELLYARRQSSGGA